MTKQDDKPSTNVLLGTIATAHGIRGEVMLRTYTGDPEAIADYGALSDKSGKRTFKIKSLRVTPKGVIARIEGVNDRNQAESLRGTDLYVLRAQLPATEEQEFYHADLIGLEARNADGEIVGEIVAVANFGAGDLLEVRKAGTKQTDYVAFTDANVPHIDVAAGYVVLVEPELVGEAEPTSGEAERDEVENGGDSDEDSGEDVSTP
ncbi:MAG: ribosome maturation factor RimM [Hyphomicrobiaceae bacterium]|nr:ribosome maturation factor RimM [Hyphomicrobiaceae bacterium]